MQLMCCPCTDKAITDGHASDSEAVSKVPAAVTIVPIMQTFAMGGQQVMGVVSMPVCYECRGKQLAPVSKTGLVTA